MLNAEFELALLRPLTERFPNVDAAMAEIARLSAVLTLPKGTVHVISDIHGEDVIPTNEADLTPDDVLVWFAGESFSGLRHTSISNRIRDETSKVGRRTGLVRDTSRD